MITVVPSEYRARSGRGEQKLGAVESNLTGGPPADQKTEGVPLPRPTASHNGPVLALARMIRGLALACELGAGTYRCDWGSGISRTI